MYGLEAAGQWDKLIGMTEYQHVKLARPDAVYSGDLDFQGYSLMGAYMLKGGQRTYDNRSGTFGAPSEPRGAWEVSARYSMAALSDTDNARTVVGNGTEHNVTLGLSYWHNENIRVMANYVHVNKSVGTDVNVDALGLRGQVSF
jgi:phosphate-selective porin OprO/OprP